jgi:predicted metal-dependent hydrolase
VTCDNVIHRLWRKESRYRFAMPPPRPSRRPAAAVPEPEIEVRRSTRRRRTVSAYRDGDRTVVMIPARMTRAEERHWVALMVERLAKQDQRRRPGDDELLARAGDLSRRYLGGRAKPASVRWVTNQGSRWGSCTPVDASIRLSSRMKGMPAWVVDYVLVHELAHLLVTGHGPRFWAAVEGYPRSERARGYLEGVAAAAGLDIAPDVDGPG